MPRFSRVADYCVPAFLSAYILWGCYVTILEIGVGWLRQNQGTVTSIAYLVVVIPLLLSLSQLYYRLITLPADHSLPPQHPPEILARKQVPFETTNNSGDLAICQKHACKGRWKPPRAHHCSTCGVCRVGFDHHCPWIGTCVTTANRPAFMLFLLLTSVTLPIALFPVASTLIQHAKNAYDASLEDPWVLANWWHWKGSWIVFGGPGGRYLGAMFLGYSALNRRRSAPHTSPMLGDIIRDPNLLAAIGSLIAVALSLFCAALFIINLRNVYRGQTTLETHETPKALCMSPPLVWVPCNSEELSTSRDQATETSGGAAVSRLPSERPYDLGWHENMRAVLKGVRYEINSKSYDIPRLNPGMLRRMQDVVALGRVEVSPQAMEDPIMSK